LGNGVVVVVVVVVVAEVPVVDLLQQQLMN
jgi:hypothetical protein